MSELEKLVMGFSSHHHIKLETFGGDEIEVFGLKAAEEYAALKAERDAWKESSEMYERQGEDTYKMLLVADAELINVETEHLTQLAALKAESESRRKTLIEKSDELAREWKRAENTEAERDELFMCMSDVNLLIEDEQLYQRMTKTKHNSDIMRKFKKVLSKFFALAAGDAK